MGSFLDYTEGAPRLEVELPPNGRMRAPHAVARDLLRDRLRKAEVLPCGPGWLVLRTLTPSGATAPPELRETIAAGVLGDRGLSLVDFLGFLENADESGVLSAAHDDIERALFLSEGALVGASSTAPRDELGELLLKRGELTADQLERLQSEPADRRLISGLVARGLMTPDAVSRAMHAHIVQVFDRLLAMEVGVWSFSRLPREALQGAPLQLSVQGMLMDALRRLDEMQVFRQRLRSAEVTVQRVAGAQGGGPEAQVEGLDPAVQPTAIDLLDALDGPKTLAQIELDVGSSEYEVTRAAYQLLRSNLLEIVQPEAAQAAPAGPTVTPDAAREMTQVYSIAVREIFEEVAHLGQTAALRAAARNFLADEGGAGMYAQLLRNVVLLGDGTLEEDSVLRGVSRSAVTAQALYESLGELLFFLLYQATELLGRRRGDDLARRVRMIHNMLPYGRAP